MRAAVEASGNFSFMGLGYIYMGVYISPTDEISQLK